ncbi:early transcribed membrane protein [Plasmodium chabaudi chabaudi]|uniref:Early transcribed membrane protein n=1 Tax=Plasmodium chabaudi chabaudi TaxID=31271 RepID=A0A1D3LC84_PLACU|nr:early transcribed membrane protein [Plasmodium chabaudi chabaudi]
MKLAKAFYFVAFLLAVKVLTPGSNNYVEAKPAKSKKVAKGGNGFIRKIKDNKIAFLSTLAATIGLAIGTTFGVMHLQKKKGGNKKPLGGAGKKPTPAPEVKNPAPEVKNPAPEVKNPAPEVKNPAPAVKNPAPEVRTPSPEVRTPSPEVRTPSPEVTTPASESDIKSSPYYYKTRL